MDRAQHSRYRIAPRRLRERRVPLVVVAVATVVALAACTATSKPLGKRPAPTGPAERTIVFPLATEVKFSDTFGAPRSGGRTHQGQDLMAPKGTPVVAVADGTITWMRHTNGGNAGNYVVLTDSEGWEYWYMHLNNDTPGTDDALNRYEQAFAAGIRKGQKVKVGEALGWVGDSGNAESTGAHLHFEMHDTTDVAVNGFNSLAAAALMVRTPAEAAADAPFGNVDSIARGGTGLVEVTGWAIDRHLDDAIWVSVYVDGTPVVVVRADLTRPDVEAANPGRGAKHGFRAKDVTAPAGAKVCVVLHSVGGGGNTRAGCQVVP